MTCPLIMIYLFFAGLILAVLTTATTRAIALKRTHLAVFVVMIHTYISLSSLITIVNVDDEISKLAFILGTGLGTFLTLWFDKTNTPQT